MTRVGDAQARQELGCPRARSVAANLLVPVVQFGERVAVRGMLEFLAGERGFDLAQLDVAVEHEVEGRALDRGRLLRDVRCPGGGRSPAGVRVTAQQREQAGLATAVGADDADFLPGMHRQRGILEQATAAACEGQVVDAEHAGVVAANETGVSTTADSRSR